MLINEEKCNSCKVCISACTQGAIIDKDEKIEINTGVCANSEMCPAAMICPQQAIERAKKLPEAAWCENCPVECQILPEKIGDCGRYTNREGEIVRIQPLMAYEEVTDYVGKDYDPVITKPLLSGIGAGTNQIMPPAPFIVQEKVEGVDVVTCVTEAQLGFSGMKLKIDAEPPIGEEGSEVLYNNINVGRVEQEEYGSKMIALGGIKRFAREKDGWVAMKVVVDIANRKKVALKVQGGSALEVQVGKAPIIDGVKEERRRFVCGGGSAQLLNMFISGFTNETITFGRDIIGKAGPPRGSDMVWRDLFPQSALKLKYENPLQQAFPSKGGSGWGGTEFENPLDVIESFDPQKMQPGYKIFFSTNNYERCAFYEFRDGNFEQIEIPKELEETINTMRSYCEPAKVSAFYTGGLGGAARMSVVPSFDQWIKLNKAVNERRVHLTIGGAPVYIFSGGGINCYVDVSRVKPGSFYWTTGPGTVCPAEWTLKLEDYKEIGGDVNVVRPLQEVLKIIKNS
jgi:hypothetical protein